MPFFLLGRVEQQLERRFRSIWGRLAVQSIASGVLACVERPDGDGAYDSESGEGDGDAVTSEVARRRAAGIRERRNDAGAVAEAVRQLSMGIARKSGRLA